MTFSILILEDTVVLAEAIADMLRMEGFKVTHSTNGKDALTLLEGEGYDLIISDLRMPGMDGIEFIKRVRRSKTLKATPIIILSAQANEESKLECMQAGADLFLVKPFDEQELVSSINHFLG